MELTVNGQSREFPEGLSVAGLLKALGKDPTRCAVEVNKMLVTRRTHAETMLDDGDVVEIVTLAGGG